MAENIESFVSKLQNEGIQAGQTAAEKIRADAEREARSLIEAAENQARKIVQEAQAESEKIQTRTKTELGLAARDAVGKLQETLSHALSEVLLAGSQETLNDVEFLKGIIHETVQDFIRADLEGKGTLHVHVSPANQGKLARWAIEEMYKKTPGREVALKGLLAGAGFEYTTGNGTVEVTPDSTAALLTNLVSPELRRIITEATSDENR